MAKEKEPISKDSLIGDVIQKYPKSVEIMLEHGMHCVGCHVATWETLEQGAKSHGINVENLVKDLKKKLKVN